jgi:hypothetical protein
MPLCCSAEGADNCDGKIIPTQDKDRGKDYVSDVVVVVVVVDGPCLLPCLFLGVFLVIAAHI